MSDIGGILAKMVFAVEMSLTWPAKDFIRALLQANPATRPTAEVPPQTQSHVLTIKAALKHVWLTGKTANDTTDLLPNVKEGCTHLYVSRPNIIVNARRKFRHAFEASIFTPDSSL